MKIKGIIVAVVVMSMMLGSCAKTAIQMTKLNSKMDSISYAFGVYYYSLLSADSLDLNAVLIAKAMIDGKEEKSDLTEDEARNLLIAFISEKEAEMAAQAAEEESREAEANKELYKDYIEENRVFLARNSEREGVTVTPSGLQYEVLKMGKGRKPMEESTVRVHYVGTLIDGTEFDSSVKRNEPAEFPLSGVISGWTEALQLMPVGSKFRIYLPENLAYGANGAGEDIKPFSTLIFEVELLDILE